MSLCLHSSMTSTERHSDGSFRRIVRWPNLLFAAIVILATTATPSFGQIRLASRFGETTVGGERVVVHVTVAVPPGADANTVADDAIRGQGARPFAPEAFTTNGLVWDQFFDLSSQNDWVQQYYNPTGEPVSAAGLLQTSESTWTNVTTSRFVLQYAGVSNRCPSLVKECPGTQLFDGFNDVGWLSLNGCCTLAVTWYGTSTDEADMVLNTRFPWTTNPNGNGYDVQTVMLHENGHVVGLGHSPVSGSVMQAAYAGVQRSLGQDDERGETYLYPEANAVDEISGTVTDAGTGAPIAGATIQVADLPVSVKTDSSGNYTLSNIPEIGSYSVTASARRYLSDTLDSVDVPSTTVNFVLNRRQGR